MIDPCKLTLPFCIAQYRILSFIRFIRMNSYIGIALAFIINHLQLPNYFSAKFILGL
jgi:hypothetical protein